MFSGLSLESLPDISKWNIENVKDISNMFSDCYSLKSLPDISKWNFQKIINMKRIFSGCSNSLETWSNISKWNIENVKDISIVNFLIFPRNRNIF